MITQSPTHCPICFGGVKTTSKFFEETIYCINDNYHFRLNKIRECFYKLTLKIDGATFIFRSPDYTDTDHPYKVVYVAHNPVLPEEPDVIDVLITSIDEAKLFAMNYEKSRLFV
jgi:hypothetical protein